MSGVGDFIKGAGGGAMAGGAAGGGYGAIAGGILGGLAGGFGDNPEDEQRKRLQDYYNTLGHRQAPQLGPAAQSANSGFRSNQNDLIQRLDAISRGQGPSLATQMLQQGQDKNMANQASIAASGRGGGGLAALAAANNSALGQQATNQQAAAARIAEINAANEQLGGAINQGRTADEQNSQFNASAQNAQQMMNLQAKLKMMGMDDEQIRSILQQMGSAAGGASMGDQILAGGGTAASLIQKGGGGKA